MAGQQVGKWLSPRDCERAPGDEGRVRLFCLPHAGSGAAGFYRWKRLLAPRRVDVCPVLLPGREGRFGEPACVDAAAAATELVAAATPYLHQPYAIFGHSMGALLAWCWAVALEDAGLPPPMSLLVSGRDAPVPEGRVDAAHAMLHALGDTPMLAGLAARYGMATDGVLNDPELRAHFLPVLRADLQLVETSVYPRSAGLRCPVVAFGGRSDRSVTQAGLEAWCTLTRGDSRCERLPGDHFYHFGEGQAELLDAIVAALAH